MRKRFGMAALLLLAVLLPAACGGGIEATPIAATERVCTDTFCAEYPADWEIIDQGEEYVSFSNPLDPEVLLASVGPVNMEGVVTANGETWPQTVSGVVDVCWRSLDGGKAQLATKTVLPDGSVESFGSYGSGRLWSKMIPLNTVDAIGIELRAPNSSWEPHARVLFDSVVPIPGTSSPDKAESSVRGRERVDALAVGLRGTPGGR